ncbi:MAG: family 2 glycosyl transferase [Lacunisphaera sp.]|nr:family 2 glycosyl transferase [Lacunisphaera sp.]
MSHSASTIADGSTPLISAIICTHNPRTDFLNRVLQALAAQTLPAAQWELLIVDSGSTPAIRDRGDLKIPAGARVIRVDQPGLATARKAGAQAARAALLASVDDDTVFVSHYLQTAVDFMAAHPRVASCSGKILPEFEQPPPPWLPEFHTAIAIRDLGDEVVIVPGLKPGEKLTGFPHAVPVGVNISRRTAYEHYLARWQHDDRHAGLGRSGRSLASGEDNDYSLCCLEAGWSLAYVPALQSLHLMPAFRLESAYLARLARASNRSWVQVLRLHGMSPWPPIAAWTLRPRMLRAYFQCQAWKGPVQRIRWQGACGQFEGRVVRHE